MSVSSILKNMNVETFASLGECAALGKKWLEEYNKTREGPTKNSIEFHFIDLVTEENTKIALAKISQAVKSKKSLLMGVLSETLYTFYDAKATLDMLIDELDYYKQNFDQLYSKNTCVPFQLDFTVRQQELPILGRIFCPALLSKCLLRMQITDEECLPYLIVLKKIIDETKYLPTPEAKREQIDVAFVEDFSAQHYCPMVIFDDADLDSAVNALVSAAWSYQGKALWSLTHAYIQEALFPEAIEKIKSLTLRFLKSNSFYFRHYENHVSSFNDERVGDLEIFQPSPNLPHRFFIGWDPREFVEKQRYNICELGLVLLPFRTDDEGVALVNKSLYSNAASIWTEKIGRGNSISKKLDVGTVWINCHGHLKPEVPFESKKQSKIPFNGLRLLKLLQIPKENFPLIGCNLKTEKNDIQICDSMNKALNMALEASSTLKPLDSNLQLGLHSLLTAHKFPIRESSIRTEHTIKTYTELKADAVCWKESNKVVLIDISEVTPESSACLSFLMRISILLRNSVIVVASPKDLDQLAGYDLGDLSKLPKGALSFVDKALYKPRELIENSSVQKQIILAEYDSNDVSLNHVGYLTKIPYSCVSLPSFLEVFLVAVKTVWWPN